MITVNARVPVQSLQELIAYGQANPGKITFGSAGAGGASHLAAEVFQKSTGTRFVHVPYKGILQAFNDVIAGHVDMMFGFEASVGPHMHGDRVRVLAVTGAKRHPAFFQRSYHRTGQNCCGLLSLPDQKQNEHNPNLPDVLQYRWKQKDLCCHRCQNQPTTGTSSSR